MSSIGKISLDLSVNRKGFNRQVDAIGKETKKSFGVMSVAVGNIVSNILSNAVGQVGNFVKDSINKGSELTELENVVESVFTTMADKVDNFAKNALDTYGLTEKQAKKMVGTFGAMSKSFGYSEEQAYAMSTALTGLAGDVASFYNLNIDEAYTKMKSVYTGETESLKELGVVMTQTALDEFALANGFGKTTNAMSEQEKVALRLAFVQNKLASASGDVIRTQDSWANQTRKLSGQIDSFKTAIGQGLINVLTPVIQVINIIMAKLVQLANAFKSFTAMIMGDRNGTGTGNVMQEVADAAGEAAGATGGIEDSANGAAKAAKKAQKALMGFDEINKLTKADSAGGSGGAGGAGGMFDNIDFGSAMEKQEEELNKVVGKMSELVSLFKEGFNSGLGLGFEASIERTKIYIDNIRAALKGIFSDEEVVGAANNWANKTAYAFGQVTGAIVNVGQTVAENLVGGFSKYLDQNSDYIKNRFIGILDINSEINEMVGELTKSIGRVFEAFRGESAKQLTADLIGIIVNANLGMLELAQNLGHDLLGVIADPIIKNQDKIKDALENTLKPVSKLVSAFNETIKATFEQVFAVYDKKIRPAIEGVTEGVNEILTGILNAYNKYIAPVFDRLAENFSEMWGQEVQSLINNLISLLGTLMGVVSDLWKNILAPLIAWIIEDGLKALMPVIETVGYVALEVIQSIVGGISGIVQILDGIITLITGVFKSDWKKAWEGVEQIFVGIWETIRGLLHLPNVNVVATLRGVKDKTFDALKSAYDAFKSKTATLTANLKNNAGKALTSLKKTWDAFKSKTTTLTAKFKDSFTAPIKKMWNGLADKVNSAIKTINKIPGVNISGKVPKLAQGGYVKANSPQLAVIGDNKTQGEIVSPVDKMRDTMIDALSLFFDRLQQSGYRTAGADGSSGDIVIPIYLDGTLLDEVIVTAQQRRNLRSGGR